MGFDAFLEGIQAAADRFSSLEGDIGIFTHIDSDGISAASILSKALDKPVVHFSSNLTEDLLENQHDIYFFVDMGSEQLSMLTERLVDKEVFIIDHHRTDDDGRHSLSHLNPFVFGIDGPKEISSAGIAYLFTKAIDDRMTKYAYLAVIGSIGDNNFNCRISHLNSLILSDAVRYSSLKHSKDIRILSTRPLQKALANSNDPHIPGVNDFSSAKEFLDSVNIPLTKGKRPIYLEDLNDEDKRSLEEAMINRRKDENKPDDIYGDAFVLKGIPHPFNNAYEFSTLLNACGRMGDPETGIKVCLNEPGSIKKASLHLDRYRKMIYEGLRWATGNLDSAVVGKNCMILDSGNNIDTSIVGTICSMLVRTSHVPKDSVLVCMADNGGSMKISIRKSGGSIDLRGFLSVAAEGIDCTFGGHDNAAGAHMNKSDKHLFMERCVAILED